MNFDHRVGPDFGDNAPQYPDHAVPEWYRDAKLGIFVHWGLYSVPAWAVARNPGDTPVEDHYALHHYAEWYGNTVRIPGSPSWERHQRLYGPGVNYEDFADMWATPTFSAERLVSTLVDAGAKYIIPTTKHHDGFCLWGTNTTPFNAVHRGPRRDLVKELREAITRAGVRFGVYFSGALDWHASDFPPIESDTDLFRFRRNDELFARYAAEQLRELIDRFAPDILWNDIDWPDGGKGPDDFGVAAILSSYYDRHPDGIVNDRWGVPHHGFLTREYTHVVDSLPLVWESTRGLGASFGYNDAEAAEHTLSGAELIHLLVDVVSKNGNLLLNVGPNASGELPGVQARSLHVLGEWLRTNGHGVYGTRPWIRSEERTGMPRRYTSSAAGTHIHLIDPAVGTFTLPSELEGADARWSDGTTAVTTTTADGTSTIEIPAVLRATPVATLTVAR